MGESLEDFLRPKNNPKNSIASGSFQCSECNDIVHQGQLDESSMTLTYECVNGHSNRIKL